MKKKNSPWFSPLWIFASLAAALPVQASPWSEKELNARVNELLSQMTLEEKLGQLQQKDGIEYSYKPETAEFIRKGQIGSILSTRGAKVTNELQKFRDIAPVFRSPWPKPAAGIPN
jgi:hypothetical protein